MVDLIWMCLRGAGRMNIDVINRSTVTSQIEAGLSGPLVWIHSQFVVLWKKTQEKSSLALAVWIFFLNRIEKEVVHWQWSCCLMKSPLVECFWLFDFQTFSYLLNCDSYPSSLLKVSYSNCLNLITWLIWLRPYKFLLPPVGREHKENTGANSIWQYMDGSSSVLC